MVSLSDTTAQPPHSSNHYKPISEKGCFVIQQPNPRHRPNQNQEQGTSRVRACQLRKERERERLGGKEMAGEELGKRVGMREEALKKACVHAMKAHKSSTRPYQVEKLRGGEVVFGFSGAWSVDDWFAQKPSKPFGETAVDLQLFPSLKSIGKEETAAVNEAFLCRFKAVLATSSLKTEVQKAVADGKQIVFTGHSSGGAIAVLATLWCLENCIKPNTTQNLPHCVTFGSPLIGNWIFPHVLMRENWSNCFIHFVLKFDIVPRVHLTPLSSIEREMQPVLNFFNPNSTSFKQVQQEHSELLYQTVMRNAATTSSHAACNLMGSTNMLLETLTSFVDLTPYKPFGTYIICTGGGKLVTLKNPDAILQLFYYCLQLSSEAEGPEVARKAIYDHLAYEREVLESLQRQNVIHLDNLEELPLSMDGDAVGVTNSPNDLGLSTRARICLRAAGELEKQRKKNEAKIDENRSKVNNLLTIVKGYRAKCEVRRIGYYDAFKIQNDPEDFNINVKRLELAGIWDEIIEMLKSNQLPDEFETRKEWVELGTRYRRLVEPLDIANYYRHGKNDDTGPYMKKGRPRRYRCTQAWLENFHKLPPGSCKESCFLAEVEQLCIQTGYKKPFEDGKERVLTLERDAQERLLKLERDVLTWFQGGQLGKDVFLEESTFVKWWKKLPLEHTSGSCIAKLMNV